MVNMEALQNSHLTLNQTWKTMGTGLVEWDLTNEVKTSKSKVVKSQRQGRKWVKVNGVRRKSNVRVPTLRIPQLDQEYTYTLEIRFLFDWG